MFPSPCSAYFSNVVSNLSVSGDSDYQFHQFSRTQRRYHGTDGVLRICRVRDSRPRCGFHRPPYSQCGRQELVLSIHYSTDRVQQLYQLFQRNTCIISNCLSWISLDYTLCILCINCFIYAAKYRDFQRGVRRLMSTNWQRG